jgi:outer membrane protein OmpA-like peptidoglycan-associated protein
MLKLKKGGYKSVSITAYTDNLGSFKSDSTLSKARAKNVKRYLAFYLPKLKITITGLGRTNPAVPNINEAKRKQNRRAVIEASK